MEFLENAIFSTGGLSLLGVRLTTYHPELYTSRAEVSLFTLDELRRCYGDLDPRGFCISDNGTFMSDTPARYVMADSVFSYMESECTRPARRQLDTTDLVLRGVAAKGFVVVNYEVMRSDEGLEPVLIPFRNFKVSKSSFNIYASFRTTEGDYRTYSLLDMQEGGPKVFYAAFPADYSLDEFGGTVELVGELQIESMDYAVYRTNLGLSIHYASVGEAFLNYLAYNVSFYNIGETTLTTLLRTVRPVPKPSYTRQERDTVERVPHKNISIVHEYSRCRLHEYLGCGNDSNALNDLFARCPEATVTHQWVNKIKASPWFFPVKEERGSDEAYYVACTNLLQECKRDRLKCALELLTHRYFILSQGIANDNLGLVLKGGGVDGESIKQSNFWYN